MLQIVRKSQILCYKLCCNLLKNKKVLCITGARQIGKITLIKEFAKKNHANFVEI